MLFTTLGRSVLGKIVAEVLSPMRTSKLTNNIFLLKGIPRLIRRITSCNGADADINWF